MQVTASKPKRAATTKGRSAEVERRSSGSAGSPAARHQNEGHGRRLTRAFEALEAFPALAESRNRLLAVISGDHVATADIVTAVESDVALIIAVLRLANQAKGSRVRVDTIVAAVELLSPQIVQALAGRVRTFEFFERSSVWDAAPERFRLHALATQRAADRVAAEVGYEHRDRLTVTSLLHDIGKLVLAARLPRISRAGASRGKDAGGTHPSGAPGAGRRSRAGGWRARPALGAAGDHRHRDRASSQPRCGGRGRFHPPGGHARALRAGRAGVLDGDAADRAVSSASPRRS